MCVTRDKLIDSPDQRQSRMERAGIALATTDGVDLTTLASLEDAQAEGEPDLINELIDLYLEDVADKMAVMREAIAKSDEAALKSAAHSLRGSSASLGAWRMASVCKEIERMDFADLLSADALQSALEHACEVVRRVLTAERLRRLSVKL